MCRDCGLQTPGERWSGTSETMIMHYYASDIVVGGVRVLFHEGRCIEMREPDVLA